MDSTEAPNRDRDAILNVTRASTNFSGAIPRYKDQLVRSRDRRGKLSELKLRLPDDHITPLLSNLGRHPYFRNLIAPGGFPKTFSEICPGSVLPITALARELVWTAAVLKVFERELSEFVVLERRFANTRLDGDFTNASIILDEVQKKFGTSAWLIENRIGLLQESGGLQKQKEYAYTIFADRDASFMARFFAYHFSSRAEEALSSTKYIQYVDNAVATNTEEIADYLRFLLLPVARLQPKQPNSILAYDENCPIVDRYLGFLKISQLACADINSQVGWLAAQQALQCSQLRVDDFRLHNLVYLTSGQITRPTFDLRAAKLFDDYTIGRYVDTRNNVKALLDVEPARADLYEIYAKASSRLPAALASTPRTPLGRILSAATDVMKRNDAYAESLEYLEKLALVMPSLTISNHISAFISRERDPAPLDRCNSAEILAALNSPIPNPWQYRTFKAVNPHLSVIEDLFDDQSSSALKIQIALETAGTDLDLALDILRSLPLPQDRLELYSARVLDCGGQPERAIELYTRWLSSDIPTVYFEAARRLSWDYLKTGQIQACLDLIARAYLRSQQSYVSLPIREVLHAVEIDGAEKYSSSLSLVITYDAYSKFIAVDRDGQRSDAYEDFLLARGLSRPSQLRSATGIPLRDFDQDMLLYYLRHVCVPRVMDPSTAFDGTKDLLSERISVCQLLQEIDGINGTVYGDEIRALTQEIVVSEGLQQIEQSRIYVDTEGIRESLEKTLPESFRRFSILASTSPFEAHQTEFLKKVVQIVGTKREAEVLSLPNSERDSLFDAMFAEFRDQFVNNTVHGLAAYLSGRIRHGILPNHLRSPLELAHLATQKDSFTEKYKPNEYWRERCSSHSAVSANAIANRLAQFSEEIDNLINMVNQRWIQVHRDTAPDGLFNFTVYNVRRRLLQVDAASVANYDAFLDLMFRFFWDLTERSLTDVREKFDFELKPLVNVAFDNLQQDIASIECGDTGVELDGAIAQTRTDMNVMLERVKNWFRLAKSTEKPDFDLHTLVRIAIESANNCFRHSPLTPILTFGENGRLNGATLSTFAELLYLFLSNVILRSGISDRAPELKVGASLSSEGELRFVIENEVDFASFEARKAAEARIESARQSLRDGVASSLSVIEGGSGYAKVWKIVRHDLGCSFVLEFGLKGKNKFCADLKIDAKSLMVPA